MTMYLNDCQRTAFYEGIGLNTKEFDMHVIIEVSLTATCISSIAHVHPSDSLLQ